MARRITTEDEIYFVTVTIVDWIDVFTRRNYFELLIENLQFCQQHKGLFIYSYCIMTNHLHLIASCNTAPLNVILGHFKSYTSRKLVAEITENLKESRREWMLNKFLWHKNPSNKKYQFWQQGNYPILLYAPHIYQQKEDYIHNNPVKAGFVNRPEDYLYSSAHPDSPITLTSY